jgi:hypothetical protein
VAVFCRLPGDIELPSRAIAALFIGQLL